MSLRKLLWGLGVLKYETSTMLSFLVRVVREANWSSAADEISGAVVERASVRRRRCQTLKEAGGFRKF